MQNSTTKGKHASMEIIDKMIRFAELAPGTTTIQISGGEPTTHPEFITILKKIVKKFKPLPITIITNGEGFYDKEQLKKVLKIMEKSENVLMQITSVKGIYKDHDTRVKFLKKKLSKIAKKKPEVYSRILLCLDLPNGIIPVGRAKQNIDKLKELSFIAERKSTSCFNMYSSLQGNDGNLFKAIDYVKANSMATFCKPLIKENGKIVFGEYQACQTIIDLSEFTLEMMNNMHDMVLDVPEVPGPCGNCVNTNSQQTLIDQYLNKFKYNCTPKIQETVEKENSKIENILETIKQVQQNQSKKRNFK
jgi:organic radical activating enzyme